MFSFANGQAEVRVCWETTGQFYWTSLKKFIHQGMLMSISHKLCVLMSLGWLLFLPQVSHSQEPKKLEMISVGIRGGLNLDPGGIPPGEKEDFQQYDVFGILGFPGSWEWPRGWEARYRWYASAGVIKAAGDKGFIATLGPGLAFTKWDWNLTLEFGTGAVYVAD